MRRNEDTFSLQMVDADGQLHLLDKAKLASVVALNQSLASDGLRQHGSPRTTSRTSWPICAR